MGRRRRGMNLAEHAMTTHNLASIREMERQIYEENREQEREDARNGIVHAPPKYKSVSGYLLGLFRKGENPAVSEDERRFAIEQALGTDRESEWLPYLGDDLRNNLSVLRYTASVYFKSPVLAVLTVLMLAGHAGMLMSVSTMSSGNGMGSPVFGAIFLGWTIFNIVALTLLAFTPILFTSIAQGIWSLFGGKSHRFIQLFFYTSVIPPLLMGSLLTFNQSGVSPLVPAVFAGHVLLPLVIRILAAKRVTKLVNYLTYRHEILQDEMASSADSDYLESLLERKVIGTPGASLGTSEFGSEQVAAGVAGERKTARVLDQFARDHDNAIVFHSVRWNMDGAPYDIDHVVVVGSRVFFLDSKNWSAGNYKMLASGDTVLKDSAPIPNGSIHVQAGADTYINAFDIRESFTQIVVWTDGSLSNESHTGPRLVKSSEMLDWLKQSATDPSSEDAGYNVDLLRRLEANAA